MIEAKRRICRLHGWHGWHPDSRDDECPLCRPHPTKSRPLEAAAIAAMTDEQRLRMLGAMERGFARGEPWWRKLLPTEKTWRLAAGASLGISGTSLTDGGWMEAAIFALVGFVFLLICNWGDG